MAWVFEVEVKKSDSGRYAIIPKVKVSPAPGAYGKAHGFHDTWHRALDHFMEEVSAMHAVGDSYIYEGKSYTELKLLKEALSLQHN
jgi:hypothetical protein